MASCLDKEKMHLVTKLILGHAKTCFYSIINSGRYRLTTVYIEILFYPADSQKIDFVVANYRRLFPFLGILIGKFHLCLKSPKPN